MKLVLKKRMRMAVIKVGRVEAGLVLQSWRIYLMVIVSQLGLREPKVIGFEWLEGEKPHFFRM